MGQPKPSGASKVVFETVAGRLAALTQGIRPDRATLPQLRDEAIHN